MCKKFIMALVIVAVLFNFIANPFCFAGSGSTVKDTITFLLGTFVGVITWIPRVIALGIGYAIDALAAAVAYVDGATEGNNPEAFITPFEIVFNRAAIVDIDFFDFEGVGEDTVIYKIRTAVAGWYYFMRLIAVAVLLVILIYVGIRMAISTIAEDKAKYKKMLVDWVASLALVFLLQYIMVFLITLNQVLVDAMAKIAEDKNLGDAINTIAGISLQASIEGIGATIVFFLFVVQTFSILFSYINRMIRVAFLIIIAPLITITYSLDKMGDGKAQALNEWLKEFLTSVLIQPFHCVIYMVFVSIAIDLLTNPDDTGTSMMASAIIAILCMLFIKDAEKIVRKIFNLNGDDNASSIAAGAAVASAALHKSKDIGKSVRQGVNMAKEMKPVQRTKEAFTSVKNGVKATARTIADGKNGPGLAANYNKYAAESQKKTEEKREAKVAKKEAKEERRMERLYEKNSGKLSEQDKSDVKNRAKAIKKENPGMTSQEALKRARVEKAREKIKSGEFKDRKVSAARGFTRAARVMSQSNIGKFVKSQVSLATGIAAGAMALNSEDLFTAFATGGAAKGATDEFMKSSNAYIADEAAGYVENLSNSTSITSEDIVGMHSDLSTGKLEKERDDAESDLTAKLKALSEDNKITKNGQALDDQAIQAIVRSMRTSLARKPSADLQSLLDGAIDQSISNVEGELAKATTGLLTELKDATNKIQIAQIIDKGTSYGASVETLAKKTVSRSDGGVPLAGDDRAIEKLYEANETLRNTTIINDNAAAEIVRKVREAGHDIDSYISRMKKAQAAMDDGELKNAFERNIRNLERYRNSL